MDHSRVQRRRPLRARKRFVFLAAALIVCAGAAIAVAWVSSERSASQDIRPASVAAASESATVAVSYEATSSASASSSTEPSAATGSMLVEVPEVAGKPLNQAELVLSLAGFTVERAPSAQSGGAGTEMVVLQEPAPGERLKQGSTVTLTCAIRVGSPGNEHYVVCIDAGHQAKADLSKEPIGPGSDDVKPAVSGGATGVVTGVAEHVVTLQVSMRLKRALEAQGVQVVMTRTNSDVTLTNRQRADIANRAGADLFIRVHADGAPNPSTSGFSVLFPAENKWTAPIAARSEQASTNVHDALVRTAGARDRGCVAREDITGFNWAKVPAIIVEMGFLTNVAEDRKMSTPAYQEKLAKGMATGVLAYLRSDL